MEREILNRIDFKKAISKYLAPLQYTGHDVKKVLLGTNAQDECLGYADYIVIACKFNSLTDEQIFELCRLMARSYVEGRTYERKLSDKGNEVK